MPLSLQMQPWRHPTCTIKPRSGAPGAAFPPSERGCGYTWGKMNYRPPITLHLSDSCLSRGSHYFSFKVNGHARMAPLRAAIQRFRIRGGLEQLAVSIAVQVRAYFKV
eukprot:scaffold80082_cov18-Tisochrysis_lutea.AAC.2